MSESRQHFADFSGVAWHEFLAKSPVACESGRPKPHETFSTPHLGLPRDVLLERGVIVGGGARKTGDSGPAPAAQGRRVFAGERNERARRAENAARHQATQGIPVGGRSGRW